MNLDYVPSWLDGATTILQKLKKCIEKIEELNQAIIVAPLYKHLISVTDGTIVINCTYISKDAKPYTKDTLPSDFLYHGSFSYGTLGTDGFILGLGNHLDISKEFIDVIVFTASTGSMPYTSTVTMRRYENMSVNLVVNDYVI